SFVWQAEVICDLLVRDFAVEDVDALEESGILGDSVFPAHVSDLESVLERDVGQPVGRSAWHSTWHVWNSVVNDAVHRVGWVLMAGWAAGFNGSTLVNCDVNNDATGLHAGDHFAVHKLRSLCAWNENSADHEV